MKKDQEIIWCLCMHRTFSNNERNQPGTAFTLKTFESLLIESPIYFPGTLTLEKALIFDYSTRTYVLSGLEK